MNPVERRDLAKRPFTPKSKTQEANVSANPSGSANRLDDQESSASVPGADAAPPPVFEQFHSNRNNQKPEGRNDIDMIMDIPVQLTVQLGRTKIAIKNLLQLAQGSVVELDGLAGEPMDVLVNGYLIAQGEVVVVNEKFGIRLTDIITPSERIRKLSR